MSRGPRLALLALLVVGLCVALVFVGYPELILRAMSEAARRSAGLELRTVEVGGDRIAYLDGGDGPAIVLLHGFGASKDVWNPVAARLTPDHRVIAPDLPGFGDSPYRATEQYDLESQARRLRALLDVLGVREHHIGGNSMGAAISVVYATAYPAATRSLLIGAAPGVRSPEKSDLERSLAAGHNPLLVRDTDDFDALMELAFFRPPSIPAPMKRAMLAYALQRQTAYARIFEDLTELREGGLEPLLPRVQARTLVAWGEGDRLVHPSSVPVFTAAIPGSESVIFEACGHALPRECPDPMAQRYLAFLASTP